MLDSAAFLALLSAACFGLGLVLNRRGLAHFSPLRGSAFSVPITLVLLILLSPFTVDWSAFDLRAAAIFSVVGLVFPSVVVLLTYQSNFLNGPYVTASVGNLAPLFAVFFAILVLGDWPNGLEMVAIATIVAGATLMVRGGNGGGRRVELVYLLLPLSAAFVRGVVQPAIKAGLASWPDPFAALLICYVFSAAVLIGVNLANRRAPFVPTRAGVAWFAAVGVTNGAAALLMYAALARGPVSEVAPLVACFPLATLVFGRLFGRGDGITTHTVLGVILAVGGVAMLLAF